MQKFTISVMRYQNAEIEVEAENYEEARKEAVDAAMDTDWSNYDGWYQTANENGVFED